ncbi:MAG: GatB/YqeY domain-containing protein [Bdellovibrionaceae bacterium]|nr:GatB/YqeY domain-containing protein [Pseudobdellovibrionaceae bacterium]
MSLKEKILTDIKEAMKNKDTVVLSTLRFLNSAIKNKEIELRPNAITDEDVVGVIKKSVKQRQDSIEQYEKAGRPELADNEKAELKILETYLPAQLSEDQIAVIVREAISATGASTMKDMGGVMSYVREKTGGNADNRLVSQIVKNALEQP